MLTSLLLLPLLIITIDTRDRIPPRYQIDLDTNAVDRWNQIIDDHREMVPAIIDETK